MGCTFHHWPNRNDDKKTRQQTHVHYFFLSFTEQHQNQQQQRKIGWILCSRHHQCPSSEHTDLHWFNYVKPINYKWLLFAMADMLSHFELILHPFCCFNQTATWIVFFFVSHLPLQMIITKKIIKLFSILSCVLIGYWIV